MIFKALSFETSNSERGSASQTKDIDVFQQVMGHASMQVTLGYLRNLEVPVFRVEDMSAIFS